jgi:hypothetical protein
MTMVNAKTQFAGMCNALGWLFLVATVGLGGMRMIPTPALEQLRVVEGTLTSAENFVSNKGGKWLELKVKTANEVVEARVQANPDEVYQKLETLDIGVPVKIWIDGDMRTAEIAQVQAKNETVLPFTRYQTYHANDRDLMTYAMISLGLLGLGLLVLGRQMERSLQ